MPSAPGCYPAPTHRKPVTPSRSLATGVAALAFLGAAPATGAVAQPDHSARAVVAKSCVGSTRAVIGGQIKCLRRGQFCAVR